MATNQVLNSKSLCIITGGSRGIGRAIAVTFSMKFCPGSVIVLTGRSPADLTETKRQVQAGAPGVTVNIITADLANAGTLHDTFSGLTKDVNPSEFQHVLLIHNAGSINDTSQFMRQMNTSDVDYMQQYFTLNLTSALLLTSHVLRTFPHREGLRRTVINITSLAAIKPMKTCGLYCMGKAARDMMLKTAAAEEPEVRFLNYAPGPVDTDMYREICKSADQELREMMIGVETNKVLLKPPQTAARLACILEGDAYESGAHIDYFDDVPQKEDDSSSSP